MHRDRKQLKVTRSWGKRVMGSNGLMDMGFLLG